MNHANAYKLFLLAAASFAGGGLTVLTGCKNTTSAAEASKTVGPPPTIRISALPQGAPVANPITDPAWQNTQWYLLVPPSSTPHTTSETRAALLYDADNLYVAFVSNKPDQPAAPDNDIVSVYLDTIGDGTEVVRIDQPSDASAPTCTWIRSTVTAATREATAKSSGGLDTAHPIVEIPFVPVKGLTAHTQNLTTSGASAWTTVLTIPLQSLPLPLRTSGSPGAHWKVNLLRTTVTGDPNSGSEVLQSNLSPVYRGGQSRCQYRMAQMVLESPAATASLGTTAGKGF